MRKWEQHKTSKWVRSPYVSAYVYGYVGGFLTCYAYVILMRLLEPAFTWNCNLFTKFSKKINNLQKQMVFDQ